MAVIVHSENSNLTGNFKFNILYVYIISAIAALGGVLFGFDLVIISGTVTFFKNHFQLSEFETGWAVGCINLGAAIGALLGGKLSNSLGRRKLLMICAVIFGLTGIGTGWADSFLLFVTFRLSSGVAVGIAAMVCPMYVAEISPASMRGKMVSFYQLSIVIGILLAYLSNYLLLDSGNNNWRWMFSSQSIPSVLFFIGLFFVAESPRWLIEKKDNLKAYQILTKIGGTPYADAEVKSIEASFYIKGNEKWNQLFSKDFWHIVFVGIVIAVCSQAVGQNSLFSYAPELFKKAGMNQDSAFLQAIIIGIINFIFTFIAIGTIDKIGRKKLLQYGSFLLFLDALALSSAFYWHLPGEWVLLFVLGFIAIYAATLGPVTWVILSEIFPNRIRASALGLATLALWIANFFTTFLFPIMNENLGLAGTFIVHGCICLIYFLFITKKVPETKGKSLEEIETLLIK